MTKLLLLAVAVAVAIPCIGGFARWERRGKFLRATVLLLVLELVEATLYENQDLMPRDLFHPGTGALQFRLPEVFITLALLGRLVARRMPRRIGYPAMLWLAFGAWLAVETVEGYLRHNDSAQIPYEAKAIVYVVGGFALASGVPVRQYLEAEVFERIVRWFAPIALVLDVMSAGHKSVAVNIPLLPLPDFGVVGADIATMFAAVGLVALMLELGKEHRNLWTIACTVPLLLSTVVASQRAALLGLAVSVLFLLAMGFGSTARLRIRAHAAELLLALAAVLALTTAVVIVPAIVDQQAPKIPFASTIKEEFSSTGKAESAQDRLNQWALAREMIPEHVFVGFGLGHEYSYWAPGTGLITTDLTHDIYLDLWVRTGLVGLGLFLAAVMVSMVDGIRVWRRHPDPMVGILALALVAALIGLLVKGGVESIFEKYRLATLLGLLLGMLRSTVTSAGGSLPSATVSPAEHRADRGV